MRKKKLGLALGSGGARGIAHIGFLDVLDKNNIPISFIAGSSMGAVVGAIYSMGHTPAQMEERAKVLKMKDVLDLEFFFFKKMGFIKGNKRETLLNEYLENKNFSDCKIPFCCTAVDIMTGEKVLLNEGLLCRAVMASSAIPSVFAPVEIEGRKMVDGGLLTRLPIDAVKEMGADTVIAVDVLGDRLTDIEPGNIISTLIRTINIMDWELTKFNLHKADLVVTVEQPEVDQFRVKNLEKSLEAGKAAAEKALPYIRELLR